MSKGPKKKPVGSKTGSKAGAKDKAQAAAIARPEKKTGAGAGGFNAGFEKKINNGNAAVAVIVFLSVLSAGAYINLVFWSETVVPAKTGPAKTGTQDDKTTPGSTSKPDPASEEGAPSPVVQKVVQKDAAKETLADSTGDSVEKMTAERRQLRQSLDRLMARMESIEKSLDQVTEIARATAPPAEKLGSPTAPSPNRLGSLEESEDKIKALMQRMDKMEKDYAQTPATVSIAPAGGAAAGSTPGAGALMLAVGNLRQALAADEPFDKALDALKALAEDSPEVSAAVTLLAKNASRGLATKAVLAERFEALAGKIVQASRAVEEKNWLDRAVNRMSKLVSWRRIDGKGEKTSVDTLVAAAETQLKAGNLKSAIKTVEGLSAKAPGNTKAAAVAASWLADAKARVAADRAVAGLHLHALSLLTLAPLVSPDQETGARQ